MRNDREEEEEIQVFTLDRNEAEELFSLLDSPDEGTFIIRKKVCIRFDYVPNLLALNCFDFCVQTGSENSLILSVIGQAEVRHILLTSGKDDDGGDSLVMGGKVFRSLSSMVDYHRAHSVTTKDASRDGVTNRVSLYCTLSD
jgi:hypothetical protein